MRAKQECWIRCHQHIAEKENQIRNEYQELEEQFVDVLNESKKEEAKLPPLCMTSAAVSVRDLEQFQALMGSSDFCAPSRMQITRCDITTGPGPLAVLVPDKMEIWCRREAVMPGWVRDFVAARDFWGECALVSCGESGETEYWKVVYAVQSPSPYLAVCKLEPVKHTRDRLPAGSSAGAIARSGFAIAFKCSFGIMQTAADMGVASMSDLSILLHLRHEGGTIVTSPCEPLPIMHFMGGKPTPRAVRAPRSEDAIEQAKDKVFDDIVLSMPWLQDYQESQGFAATVVQKAIKKAAALSAPLPVAELDGDELMDALADVEKATCEESAIAMERCARDFKTNECHGESNVKKGCSLSRCGPGHLQQHRLGSLGPR